VLVNQHKPIVAIVNEQTAPAILAKSLCKYYGEFTAIEDVDFTIPTGQVVAFLGPNGAGKSTTIKILAGYLAPNSGEAIVAGFNVATHRLEAARCIGYMPENGPLYPDMTPRTLLTFTGQARGMTKDRIRARIEQTSDHCGLEAILDKPIHKLSRGFRQRVGVALCLLHEPEILIMDEPTSGLDPNQIQGTREMIRELGKTKTILLTTHILQEVEAMADRVILIHQGKVAFDGTVEDFIPEGQSPESRFHELTGVKA